MATAPPTFVSTPRPRPAIRAVVSLLVILHVAAVFVGPLAMSPTSQLAAGVGSVMQPYLDVLSLGNGYRFFAPEPGPSHLVRYEIIHKDGTLEEGFFPNRDEQWPRLLYHRYFMMSEFANTLENGPARDRAEAYALGYAKHLAEAKDARTVKLYLKRHYVPRPEEVQQGRKLNDKMLYEERPLATYERD